jgi:hypothetical protein
MNDALKAHYVRQLVAAGNSLEEIGTLYPELHKVTAEVFAMLCLMAQHAGVVDQAEELIDKMKETPDTRLDIVDNILENLVETFRFRG